jgi:hypothetical protein
MVEQITHVVEYDYWYRCSYGMELGCNQRTFVSESAANDYSDFLKKNDDVVSVRVVKLDKPFMAGSQFED